MPETLINLSNKTHLFQIAINRFIILPALLLTFLLETLVVPSDFDKGVDSILKGDYATALREWKPLAEQGNAKAQFSLGMMYEEGNSVTKNYKTAVKWYRLAVEQGDAIAQNNLAFMYGNGIGVKKIIPLPICGGILPHHKDTRLL